MNDWYLVLLALPFLSACIIAAFRFFSPTRVSALAIGLSGLIAMLTFLPYVASVSTAGLLFDWHWVTALGLSLTFSVDALSLLMLTLSNTVFFLVFLMSYKTLKKSTLFYSALFVIQIGLTGLFGCQNALLFYIFWEITLVPVIFLLMGWGQDHHHKTILKYVLYSLAGSFLMLGAFIFLYTLTPAPHSFDFGVWTSLSLPPYIQNILFWMLFIAFAIKTPLIPFHRWQLPTYSLLPYPANILVASVLSKMGLYAILRFFLALTPTALVWNQELVVASCVISALIASFIALKQKTLTGVLAYLSVAHLSLVVASLFTLESTGFHGAVFQIVAHTITTVGFFYCISLIKHLYGTDTLAELSGLKKQSTLFSASFFVIVLSLAAVPFTSGFVGEFLMVLSIFVVQPLSGIGIGITLVVGAWVLLNTFHGTMLGTPNATTNTPFSTNRLEKTVLILLVIFSIGLGLFPNLILQKVELIFNQTSLLSSSPVDTDSINPKIEDVLNLPDIEDKN